MLAERDSSKLRDLRITSKRKVVLIAVFALVLLVLLIGPLVVVGGVNLRRTTYGRIVRWCLGEPGATQAVNDVAEDIERKIGAEKLQEWATKILARYDDNSVSLAGQSGRVYGAVKLSDDEIPGYIRETWPRILEVSVDVSESGKAKCVVISWFTHGIRVGDPNYVVDQPHVYWYLRYVKPGICVFHTKR